MTTELDAACAHNGLQIASSNMANHECLGMPGKEFSLVSINRLSAIRHYSKIFFFILILRKGV